MRAAAVPLSKLNIVYLGLAGSTDRILLEGGGYILLNQGTSLKAVKTGTAYTGPTGGTTKR